MVKSKKVWCLHGQPKINHEIVKKGTRTEAGRSLRIERNNDTKGGQCLTRLILRDMRTPLYIHMSSSSDRTLQGYHNDTNYKDTTTISLIRSHRGT